MNNAQTSCSRDGFHAQRSTLKNKTKFLLDYMANLLVVSTNVMLMTQTIGRNYIYY
jgi:hypothetical protein